MRSLQSSKVRDFCRQLFGSPVSSVLTLVILVALGSSIYFLWNWGISEAIFRADLEACTNNEFGACWGFVTEKWRLIIFGRYPYDMQWRPALATALVIAMLIISAFPQTWTKKGCKILCAGWVLALLLFFILMEGGIAGLPTVESDSWGGLPLTVILTLIGMTASAPIGILLAIGRRSKLVIIRSLSIGYIELVRGVPLITVLFFATFIFPLILPAGWRIDPFWRIVIGIVLFQAAYMAETVRGGLQTIPKGQFDVSDSLGMNRVQTYLYIILPQALVKIIPAFVNSLLSTFMDTSLVTIVSMYDLTGSLRLALGDPEWRTFFLEGYLFIALIYFVSSFVMSRYSIWLEKYVQTKEQKAELMIS